MAVAAYAGVRAVSDMDAEAYLVGLFDFEKQRSAGAQQRVFKLDRVRAALDALSRPERGLRLVHVAGTKGKGSTVEYIQRLLQDRHPGMRIGLFTSPHLIHMRERIRIGVEKISSGDLLRLSRDVDQLNRREFDGQLTFFEVLFVMAMLYFRDMRVDIAILETGLGGRLDATNAITAELSILTRIDYDHMDMLGYDIRQIAAEKAGIIKRNKVLALRQREEVNEVIALAAQKAGADLHWHPGDESELDPRRENGRLALQAVNLLMPEISGWMTLAQLTVTPVSGRLQKIVHRGQVIILDVAHNEISMRALAVFLRTQGENFALCFAMAQGRDPLAMLKILQPVAQSFTFCPLPGERPGIATADLQRALVDVDPNLQAEILGHDQQALGAWLDRPTSGIKVVTGSFYLVGEAMRWLQVQV